jgi:hypothetical protein
MPTTPMFSRLFAETDWDRWAAQPVMAVALAARAE